MSMTICPEDLLVLARRRALSAQEQRLLDEHAADCKLCHQALAIGARLDPLPAIDDDRTDDEVLAARLVARTLAPRPAGSSPAPAFGLSAKPAARAPEREPRRARLLGRRAPRWAFAAVVVLMAGSASAALWQLSSWRLPWSFGTRPAATAPTSQERPRARRRAETRPPAPSAALPPSDEMRVALAKAIPSAPAAAATRLRPAPAGSAPMTARAAAPAAVPSPPIADASAPALFRAANQARRAGELGEALHLYRALQAGFPGSAEATLSFLSLGDLCLSRGALADALEQFDAYLSSGDAALAEEALVGRARTLARLGRTADERETWQRLLASHPRSDYRWRAQQRLDALSAIAP
jgi:TolA-binding protein